MTQATDTQPPTPHAADTDGNAPGDDARKKRVERLGCAAIALVLIAIAAGLFAVGYSRWHATPEWWTDYEAYSKTVDDEQLDEMVKTLNARVADALSADLSQPQPKPGASSSREVFIPLEEINAWLRVELADYLAHKNTQLPPEISHPMVVLKNGQIGVAVKLKTKDINQVVHMWFDAKVNDQAKLRISLERIYAGKLRVPRSTVTSPLRKHQTARQLLDATDDLSNIIVEPVMDHPGEAERDLRLTAVQVLDTGLKLTLRNEPHKK